MGTAGTVVGRLRNSVVQWLELVFFGGAELAVLSTPAFAVALVSQNRYPDAIPIAGLFALAAGSVGVALLRAGVVDVGDWPRRGELVTLPLRTVHFSLVFLTASVGVGVFAVDVVGSLWVTPAGAAVQAVGVAAFPTVYNAIHGEPVTHPAVER
jgi:hypothetical protein